MFKTAVDRAEEIFDTPPTRNEQSVVDYIKSLKTAKRDLEAERNDPRTRMGDRDVVKIMASIREIDWRLPEAENILEAIRREIPNQEMVEDDGVGGLDVKASVEKLAVAVAAQNIGVNKWQVLVDGDHLYTSELEPMLPPEGRAWPRQEFQRRLSELVSMPQAKLAEEVKKQFPTDEWIGKPSEPVGGEGDLGYIPTHFEKDETTKPETKDSDGEFESAIEKERKFRGIGKPEDEHKKALPDKGAAKTADAVNSTPGSHEPAQSADGGAQMQAKPPEPQEGFEETIEEEQNKSQDTPRGPNRRTQKDVPAYSTPSNKLTSALKLRMAAEMAEKFENMNEQQALSIIMAATSEDEVDEQADAQGEEDSGSHEVEKKEASFREDSLEGLFDEF